MELEESDTTEEFSVPSFDRSSLVVLLKKVFTRAFYYHAVVDANFFACCGANFYFSNEFFEKNDEKIVLLCFS